MSETFHFRINDGAERTIKTKTSFYSVAAAAALAFVSNDEISEGAKIEIWVPELLPDYGPHVYAATFNEYGNVEVGILARRPGTEEA